jgi:hypothetical protein
MSSKNVRDRGQTVNNFASGRGSTACCPRRIDNVEGTRGQGDTVTRGDAAAYGRVLTARFPAPSSIASACSVFLNRQPLYAITFCGIRLSRVRSPRDVRISTMLGRDAVPTLPKGNRKGEPGDRKVGVLVFLKSAIRTLYSYGITPSPIPLLEPLVPVSPCQRIPSQLRCAFKRWLSATPPSRRCRRRSPWRWLR